MTAAPTSPRQASRRVRLTIVGDAYPVAHDPNLLRVGYGVMSSLMVNAAELGVTVEDVADERVWTDGDAVRGRALVWSRLGGEWHAITEHGVQTARDADVSHEVAADSWAVLRYQHGGDA